MDEPQLPEIKKIEPAAIFGFDGQVPTGLKVHPDKKHIVFPLGGKVSISNLETNKQDFLIGHTHTVSCLDISISGKYLASGQVSHSGFRAYVILWDWENRKEIAKHELHKVRVQAVCFTSQDKYLVSLGGQDDGIVIVFDIEKRTPLCGANAAKRITGTPFVLCRLYNISSVFIVGGERHLRLWSIDREKRKLHVQDVAVGKLTRKYTGMRVEPNDKHVYIGTMSGDVVKIRLNYSDNPNSLNGENQSVLLGCFGRHNPKKPIGKDCEKYMNGVRDLFLVKKNQLLIGAGNGIVELVEERNVTFKGYNSPTWPQFKKLNQTKVNGAVSSIAKVRENMFLIGTESCEMYSLNLDNFELKLLKTCHRTTVFDIVFPKDFPLVFASASYETIRIWSTIRLQELLRIMVYNFTAAAIVFAHDGSCIISAWNDGVLRAFTPISGKLIYAIPNAHNKGCTAIAISSNGKILVSGGCEGQVRVWKIEPHRQSLIGVLKEHSAAIASVDFNKFDTEVVSACSDGTCVIWDINRLTRKHVLYANTQFMCAAYYPTGIQILAAGTDRRISYWEVYDGSLVRELEGSTKGTINSLSLNNNGDYFVSVGNDQIVKVWDYQQGTVVCVGHGHASPIVSCRFSPCGRFFVTGSSDGAILIWDLPEEFWPKSSDIFTPKSLSSSSSSSSSSTFSSKSGSKSEPKRKSGTKSEHIEELGTRRGNSHVVCTECPPVDTKGSPDINEACNINKKNTIN